MGLSARTAIWNHELVMGPTPRRFVAALSLAKGAICRWIESTKTPLVSANSTRPLAIIRVFATKPAVSWLVILSVLLSLFTVSAMAPAWRNAPPPLPPPTIVAWVMAPSAPGDTNIPAKIAAAATLAQRLTLRMVFLLFILSAGIRPGFVEQSK